MSSTAEATRGRAAKATRPPSSRPTSSSWRGPRLAWLLLLPNLVLLLVFTIAPAIASLGIGFTRWDVINPAHFLGFDNYTRLFHDPAFASSIITTSIFAAVSIPCTLVVSLTLAVLIDRFAYAKRLFRMGFFIPVVLSSVLVGLIWKRFFDTDTGLANYLLHLIGINGPDWFGDSRWALPALIFITMWQSAGLYMLFFLVALSEVPDDILAAACIDGANTWQELMHVTLPIISPMTFFVLLNSFIGAFQVFDLVYVTTGGTQGTTVVMKYIYDKAFSSFQMGYASATAIVYLIMLSILTLVLWLTRTRWVLGER
jgi:multiple sugar transport system permease protein